MSRQQRAPGRPCVRQMPGSAHTRRAVLLGGAAALCAPALVRAQTGDLALSVSSYRLDRTAALFDGTVSIDGVAATFFEDTIGDMNTRAFSGEGNRAVTEIGLHPFMLAHANEGFRDYALLPVPLLRQFRHKSIFVRADSGIKTTQDLKGRLVGTPGYSSTSLTWIRGILRDEYGVAPSDMVWVIANKDSSSGEAGAISAQEQVNPEGVTIETGPPGLDESELLLNGEVDALIHAGTPAAFIAGDPRVQRLFADARTVERDYFRRTGIFPIMHMLAIRRDMAAEHPWLAKAVFDAYVTAKATAYDRMIRWNWATDMLPWYAAEVEDTRALMGQNFYPYGLEANRKTLETLFRYSHDQGLAQSVLTVEDVLLAESLTFEDA